MLSGDFILLPVLNPLSSAQLTVDGSVYCQGRPAKDLAHINRFLRGAIASTREAVGKEAEASVHRPIIRCMGALSLVGVYLRP